jgi:beta-N-acetylhexosaminidase
VSRAVGAFIAGCAGPCLTESERAFFADANPFGFILFSRNIREPDQLRRLTGSLRDAVGRQAPILIDQEGGRVQRLGPPYWRPWAPALEQVAAAGPAHAARSMYIRARLIAWELNWMGIDVNCAPVADIARPETHPVLRNRCYGERPDDVIACARAVAKGLMDGGVLPVLKHIPGHGRANQDSHLGLPRVKTSWTALEATDFLPFAALAELPFAMTAHIVYDAIDPALPVTVSPKGISLIRRDIGFDGFLMSDDISMKALSGDIASRTRAALRAGCDAVLHCNGEMPEMKAVAEASGVLSQMAKSRAGRALGRRRPPERADIAALEAELASLLGKGGNG